MCLVIDVHTMVAPLAEEFASVPDQIGAFHAAGRIRVSRTTSAPSSDSSDNARFASRTIATASFRFARASSGVSPCVLAPGSSSTTRCRPQSLYEHSRQAQLGHTQLSYQGLQNHVIIVTYERRRPRGRDRKP